MVRFVAETILAALVMFGTTLLPLMDGGITAQEWMAASVAGLGAALALIRQQPRG
jgi:hydrogenase/urease accessory protein HupE